MTDRRDVRAPLVRAVDPAAADEVSSARAGEPMGPRSFRRVLHAPPGTTDRAAGIRANRAALERLLDAGTFGPPRRRYLWYRMRDRGHTRTGLVAEVAAAALAAGRVVPHEATRPEREALVAAHRRGVVAESSPVTLAHRADAALRAAARAGTAGEPDVHIRAPDGVHHALWSVEDHAATAAIDAAVPALARLYVVDGHHRVAAAATVAAGGRAAGDGPDAPSQWFLAVAFPHDELRLRAHHRVVDRPRGRTTAQLLAGLRAVAEVTALDGPRRPGPGRHVVVWLDGGWYALALPDPPQDASPVAALDVTVLHDRVLGPALGLGDPRTDRRLSYATGAPRAVARHCARRHGIGFLVRPAGTAELMAVADAGGVMPPKTTLVWPKARAGLLLRHTA